MPRKSRTYGGVNSFCFIEGSRSVPPATTFTWPSYFAISAMASSRVLGRSSWKLGRLTLHLPRLARHSSPVVLDRADAASGLCRGTTANPHVREVCGEQSGQPTRSFRLSSSPFLHAVLPAHAPA